MAKIKNTTSTKTESKYNANKHTIKKSLIPEKYQNPLAVILLGLLLIIFFWNAIFNGSFFGSSDTINAICFFNYYDAPGPFPQWQPYIFGGLPTIADLTSAIFRPWDITASITYFGTIFFKSLFASDTARIVFWYIVLAAGFYFMMRQWKFEKIVSFWAAVAFIFSTNIVLWVMIGHNAKPATFAAVPYIFIMMEQIKERMSLLNIVLMIIVMHIMMAGGHAQLIFYTALMVSINLIWDFVARIIKKENWLTILKLVGVFIIASGFAFMMSGDKYLSFFEYTPYSIRGTSPITAKVDNASEDGHIESKKTKDDYDYATMWSFSPEETIDFFVPNYHGFGKVKYAGPLTNGQETTLMTYWGQKPFEDAAPYMGAIVMFLALIGIFRYFKYKTIVQVMTFLSLFALLLSFGYTFPILYDLFFYNFPMFSSFRAPSMVLIIMNFAIPILAAFGIKALIDMREEFGNFKQLPKIDKGPISLFFIAIGIFIIAGFIFAGIFENSYLLDVTNSKTLAGYGKETLQLLAPVIYDNTISDWTVIGLLSVIAAGLVYFFINKKLTTPVFVVSLLVLVLIDLWRVDYRPMDLADKSLEENPFPQTDIIRFIQDEQSKTGERYRVCDLSNQATNSNMYFFIENINGYQPAKLRNFQDMMDIMCGGSTSSVTHPFMWNLMNAKYIISNQELGGAEPYFQSRETGAYVYYNAAYCKRAFFVDSVIVSKGWDILQNMNENKYNPKTLAYIEKELAAKIVPSHQYDAEMNELFKQIQENDTNNITTDSAINSNIFMPISKIVDYKNEYIKIETETQGQHLLVVSEMYYPVAWKAYIDGKETEIYKTNYAFRSVIVPEGKHIVEFVYESKAFEMGRIMSATSNIIVILALILGIILHIRKNKKVTN